LVTIPAVAIPVKQFIRHAGRRGSLVEVLKVEFLGDGPSYKPLEFPHGRLMYRRKIVHSRMSEISDEIAKYADLREKESMLAYPAGAVLNFLYGYRNPTRYDVLRPGELDNNNPVILRSLMDQIKAERPRVLVRVKESTNAELSRRISSWAEKAGYEYFWGPKLTVWLRRD
jgi:hypothetical protein